MAQPGMTGPTVDNNMTMSIVSIFLFWPLAIPAIINASKVNQLLAQGDVAGAQAAATESKKWSRLALKVCGCHPSRWSRCADMVRFRTRDY